MTLAYLSLDLDLVEGELTSFSAECVVDGKANKLILLFPFCVIQLVARWE